MARRDPAGIRLLTRNGHDWSARSLLIFDAVKRLKVRSSLIDGDAVACDERGLAVFHVLGRRQKEAQAFLYPFDLLLVAFAFSIPCSGSPAFPSARSLIRKRGRALVFVLVRFAHDWRLLLVFLLVVVEISRVSVRPKTVTKFQ